MPHLERRYRETESSAVREELAQYLVTRACDDCGGSRLRQESRCVFVADKNLPSITKLPILAASHYFEQIQLTGQKAEIADKILKEIRDRLHFLVSVG